MSVIHHTSAIPGPYGDPPFRLGGWERHHESFPDGRRHWYWEPVGICPWAGAPIEHPDAVNLSGAR